MAFPEEHSHPPFSLPSTVRDGQSQTISLSPILKPTIAQAQLAFLVCSSFDSTKHKQSEAAEREREQDEGQDEDERHEIWCGCGGSLSIWLSNSTAWVQAIC